jgi:multiple sugar transport system substrate-binding protein
MQILDASSNWMRRFFALLVSVWMSLITTSCNGFKLVSTTIESSQKTDAPTEQRFDGITMNVMTLDKPIGETVKRHARDFEKLTGAKIVVETASFGDVYKTILQDFTSRRNRYDVVVFVPQSIVDAQSGYLEKITERVRTDKALQWDDVAPFFRNFGASYKDDVYAIPLDGDYHILYYRTDLLQQAGLEPPSTWDAYLSIAERFQGKDLNGDGQPDYGSCIPKQRNHVGHWMLWSVASSFLQSQGTQQGAFFDPKTMKPLINNEAFAKALDVYKETGKYGPPNELSLSLTGMRDLFIAGRCALAIDWGDTGTLAISPNSKVVDKVGATILPGSTKVLDRQTNKLVPCDKFTCPYAINGVNHAPYAALIGWAGGINTASSPREKDAGYAFLSYISQPVRANVDVTIGATGFNPYRISQFLNQGAWIKAGLSAEAASKYLGGIGASLNSPNIVLDLTVPQNNRYQREILDAAVFDFLTGKINQSTAIQRIEKGWEDLTNTIGRDTQQTAYRNSLN